MQYIIDIDKLTSLEKLEKKKKNLLWTARVKFIFIGELSNRFAEFRTRKRNHNIFPRVP